MILIADCVLPVTSPPLCPGAVKLEGSKITDVGNVQEICRRNPDLPKRELNGCLVMPGLVNAHTHLELTAMKNRISPQPDFVSWVLSLIEEKKRMTVDETRRSVRAGIKESLAAGTTCVGEITGTFRNLDIYRENGLRSLLYHEVLGDDPEDPVQWKNELSRQIAKIESAAGRQISIGLSPHAAYSLSEKRLSMVSDLIGEKSLPYTIHVAESEEEMDYFLNHRGEIKTRLFPSVGWPDRPDPREASTPLAYLDIYGLVTDRFLAVHGTHLHPDDMDRIREAGAKLVICPRSNHHLGVGTPPLKSILKRGISVGIGTDSLASNQSLSLWDEMRYLYTLHKGSGVVTAANLLGMATIGGARGLGLSSSIGSIESGKEADLIAVDWHGSGRNHPAADLIEKTGEDQIRMVMVAGKVLIDRK